jgi:parvulin-like peptidyl-prolyl isomerase
MPDVSHQVKRSLANETATLLMIPAVAVSVAAAQLAPVASHAPTRPRPADVVALVNDAPIRTGDLDAAVNSLVPLTAYHRNVQPEKIDELRGRALDSLIDEELRYQEALRLKVRVPDGDVDLAYARAKKAYPNEQEFERARC